MSPGSCSKSRKEAPPGRLLVAPPVPCTALLYRRVSTDEQAREGLSLEAQKARTRRYASQRGWVIGAEYAGVLTDTRADRPQYRALLEDARKLRAQGRPVAVVVQWLDRFGRSVFERARSADELRSLGVPIHSVMEGGEIPELVANLLAAVAQEEVRRFAERTAEVRRHVIASGWYFPCRAPWGYAWRESTQDERALGAPGKVLVVDAGRAPYAQEAWRRVAAGASLRAVRRWMEGLPSETRDNRKWDSRAIQRMLTAPVYIARPSLGEADVLARPAAHWLPLIEDATWQRVQERLTTPDRRRNPQRPYLLSKLLRCDKCGSPMAGSSRTDQTDQYRCTRSAGSRSTLARGCSASVLAPVMDALVLQEVLDLLDTILAGNSEDDTVLREAWRARQSATGMQDVTQDGPILEQRAQEARQHWANAATQLVDGTIDSNEYARLRDAAQAEFEAASITAARHHAEAPPDLAEVLGAAATWGPALAGDDVLVQRTILASIVERVVPVRLRQAHYRARIGWTALGEALRICAAVLPVRDTPALRAHPGVVLFRSGTMPQVTLSATSRRHRTRSLDQLRALPQPAFDGLPERDRALVELYCGRTDGEPHSWEELGKRFGIGRCRVGQILRRSMVHLLGIGSAPKTWAVLVCATCGTQFARRRWDLRRQRAYACSAPCARALRSRLQRAHGRPHAEQLRALDPAAFDRLPQRQREALTRYYGVAGQRAHTLAELSRCFSTSDTRLLRMIRSGVASMLGLVDIRQPAARQSRLD